MFADNNVRTADYYYRPSMVVAAPTLHGLGQTNPSGKTVQDFLPKDWYDSAVYRNILDMLNTLEVARVNIYNGALGQFIGTRVWNPTTFDSENGYARRPDVCGQNAEYVAPGDGFGGEAYKAFWGWAHQFTPAGNATVSHYIHKKIFECPDPVGIGNPCVQEKLKAAGYLQSGITCKLGPRNSAERHNERIKAGLGYSSADIVNLVRQLDWEMNRVHLPLPFNLRQWATAYNQFTLDNTGIGWSQRVKALRDLQKWIVIMREKVRQAINASQLARKVAEESLRAENERIIQEREAERKAREAARLQQIEAERIAAQKLIEEEKKRLQEEIAAEIAAAKKAAMEQAQQEIRQAQIQPVPPVAVKPEVTTTAPKPAPPPVPAETFQPPAVIAPPPEVAPVPEFMPTRPAPTGNALPLIAAAAAAFFFMG